jgi:hypothetical protein
VNRAMSNIELSRDQIEELVKDLLDEVGGEDFKGIITLKRYAIAHLDSQAPTNEGEAQGKPKCTCGCVGQIHLNKCALVSYMAWAKYAIALEAKLSEKDSK